MIRRSILVTLVFTLAAACRESVPNHATAATLMRADSAIYALLVDSLRGNSDSVALASEFVEFPDSAAGIPALAGWIHNQLPAVDSALVVALAEAHYSGSVQATLRHARGVRWLADHTELATPEPLAENRLISFTRVAYDPGETHALVYASVWCGGLCGNGTFYAFTLQNGEWRNVGRWVLMDS